MKPDAPAFRTTQRVLFGLILLDGALVLLGLALYPSVLQEGGLLGASAAILMVCLYGFLALYSPISIAKVPMQIWRTGAIAGTMGGIWLGLDLLSNYFIYRDGATNSKISLVVYGVYFLLMLVTAIRGSVITKRFVAGLTAALWYVLADQLIWFTVEFSSYYLFSRTAVGTVFIHEEMYADFVRSGGHNFQTFVIGDFFGAGFFHLLLIGLVAVLLVGSIGAGIGKLISSRRQP
ncbi:MAG TPA: hypothetical protein VF326_01925 [Anaerolineaceae bacterium]